MLDRHCVLNLFAQLFTQLFNILHHYAQLFPQLPSWETVWVRVRDGIRDRIAACFDGLEYVLRSVLRPVWFFPSSPWSPSQLSQEP
ncbi:unnamed protein product [Brassica napus]|uniref:(rape) hypothetical protein n=1 Tax=Brassica napus TaxID=3708 RepID=A0A816J6M1_BRANA|nr:unnamed protein product [Brassica napus]